MCSTAHAAVATRAADHFTLGAVAAAFTTDSLTNTNITFVRSTFISNDAGDQANGGAASISIHPQTNVSGVTIAMIDCVAHDNRAASGGGAIAVEMGPQCTLVHDFNMLLQNSTFTGNSGQFGGAVDVQFNIAYGCAVDGVVMNVQDCVFRDNSGTCLGFLLHATCAPRNDGDCM